MKSGAAADWPVVLMHYLSTGLTRSRRGFWEICVIKQELKSEIHRCDQTWWQNFVSETAEKLQNKSFFFVTAPPSGQTAPQLTNTECVCVCVCVCVRLITNCQPLEIRVPKGFLPKSWGSINQQSLKNPFVLQRYPHFKWGSLHYNIKGFLIDPAGWVLERYLSY